MSQTVVIDDDAKDAISEIVGMPWTKSYYDNTHDEDRGGLAWVTREGANVRVLVQEGGYLADLWHFEAEQIGQAILKASTDAKLFLKAQTEWSREQFKKLNCEIDGTQNIWGYVFHVNGKRYGVQFTTNNSFTTNKKIRTCVIVDGSGTPLFQKVTDDLNKVSKDDAAFVLKTFLQSKVAEA